MIEYFDRIYSHSKKEFFEFLHKQLKQEKRTFIVTANPETFMHGKNNPDYHKVLSDCETIITPDGIGVVKSANFAGYNIGGRITGVETAKELLDYGNKNKLTAFFYGSKPEVLAKFKEVLDRDYPNLFVLGMKDGYNYNDDEVFDEIAKKQPDIVFVTLGIPRQELLIHRNLNKFKKGIFMGCGGSIDVLSGTKKNAPDFFVKMNLEWLYRLMKEPKRIERFYQSNVKYINLIRKEIKEAKLK